MSFLDILRLSLRNLREAKLRAALTSMGVIVGVAVIVTMMSFGLGLQRNMMSRFRALDLFNEIRVFGKSVFSMAMTNVDPKLRRDDNPGDRRGPAFRFDKAPTRILDDAAIAEIQKIPGVAYVEPDINFNVYVRCNGKVAPNQAAGASVPNASSRFRIFAAGKMIGQPEADEVVVNDVFTETCGFAKPADAVGQTIEFLTTRVESDAVGKDKKDDEEQGVSFWTALEMILSAAGKPITAKLFV
jgi:ABC-type lipoprotein release transport system permease subunit